MPAGFIAERAFFCYLFSNERRDRSMDGYDNDTLLLFLDDDLFPKEEEPNELGTLESEPART